MNKTLIYLIFFINGLVFCQSKDYVGVVKAWQSQELLPGVTVTVKGSNLTTQTDINGLFRISVPDSLRVLVFDYLGFETLEYKLKQHQQLDIFLKAHCFKDWFDHQKIDLYLNGGLINNPIGGSFNMSLPPILNQITLKSGIIYQTNLNENKYIQAHLSMLHFIVSCKIDADLTMTHTQLNFENRLNFESYSFESCLNFKRISAQLGLSNMQFANTTSNRSFLGPVLGFGTWIPSPFSMTVSVNSSFYKNLSKHHVEVKKKYKKFYGFAKFDQIQNFNELSIGVGYSFYYHLKH